MTAEEKLKELYRACDEELTAEDMAIQGIQTTYNVNFKHISPEDIDLIANLVVERLIDVKTPPMPPPGPDVFIEKGFPRKPIT